MQNINIDLCMGSWKLHFDLSDQNFGSCEDNYMNSFMGKWFWILSNSYYMEKGSLWNHLPSGKET